MTSVLSMASSGSRLVAVGANGLIRVSDDQGATWFTRGSGTTKNLYCVAHGAMGELGGWVAAGEDGIILTSQYGDNWIEQVSPSSYDWYGIAYNETFFLVGGNGSYAISPPFGLLWEQVSTPTLEDLYTVSISSDSYLIAGANDTILVGSLFTLEKEIFISESIGITVEQASTSTNNLEVIDAFDTYTSTGDRHYEFATERVLTNDLWSGVIGNFNQSLTEAVGYFLSVISAFEGGIKFEVTENIDLYEWSAFDHGILANAISGILASSSISSSMRKWAIAIENAVLDSTLFTSATLNRTITQKIEVSSKIRISWERLIDELLTADSSVESTIAILRTLVERSFLSSPASTSATLNRSITQEIEISDKLTLAWENIIVDMLEITSNSSEIRRILKTLLERTLLSSFDSSLAILKDEISQDISVIDKSNLTWEKVIQELLEITPSNSETRRILRSQIESIQLEGSTKGLTEHIITASIVLSLRELVESGKGAEVLDNTELIPTLFNKAIHKAIEIEEVILDATASFTGSVSANIIDNTLLTDITSLAGAFKALVQEGISFQITFNDGFSTYTGIAMNTATNAVSMYSDLPFNSFIRIGSTYYGANSAGLYAMGADTDDGEDIDAVLTLGAIDFSGETNARVPECFLALRNDGAVLLKTLTDDNIERWYEVKDSNNVLNDKRRKLARGVHSRYWTFTLQNISGSDFELSALAPVPIILKRRG